MQANKIGKKERKKEGKKEKKKERKKERKKESKQAQFRDTACAASLSNCGETLSRAHAPPTAALISRAGVVDSATAQLYSLPVI